MKTLILITTNINELFKIAIVKVLIKVKS